MIQLCRHLNLGDEVFVAWIENDSCELARFEILDIRHKCGTDEILARDIDRDRDVCIIEAIHGLYALVDTDQFQNVYTSAPRYPVLGAAACPNAALMDVFLSLLALGYSPHQATDLTLAGFGKIESTELATLRRTTADDLETRVNDLIQNFAAGPERTA